MRPDPIQNSGSAIRTEARNPQDGEFIENKDRIDDAAKSTHLDDDFDDSEAVQRAIQELASSLGYASKNGLELLTLSESTSALLSKWKILPEGSKQITVPEATKALRELLERAKAYSEAIKRAPAPGEGTSAQYRAALESYEAAQAKYKADPTESNQALVVTTHAQLSMMQESLDP